MKTIFKKGTTGLVILALFTSTAFFTPRRSEAIVGLATGIPPLVLAGSVVAVGGWVGAIPIGLGFGTATSDPWGPLLGLAYGIIAGAALTVVGVVLLEDGSEAVQFRRVSDTEARQMQMTSAEQRAFNDSTEELNVLAEEAGLQAQKTLHEGREPAIRAAASVWDSGLVREAPELRGALEKVFRARLAAVK